MAEAITRLLENRELARAFADRAQRDALDLSSDRIARQYESLLMDVTRCE